MPTHRVPEEVVTALRNLSKAAQRNDSLTDFVTNSERLVKLFQNASKTLDNRMYLQAIRDEISNLTLLIKTAIDNGRLNDSAVQQGIHEADTALVTLASEMDTTELESDNVRALPLAIRYNPVEKPDTSSVYVALLQKFKVANSSLDQAVNPEKFAINGKFTYRATGSVMSAQGDIGSGNNGPALHDVTGSYLTALRGGIGSGNDTSGTEGNRNLARGAHIYAQKDILADNKGNLGDLDARAAFMEGERVIAGIRNGYEEPPPASGFKWPWNRS